MYVTVMGVIMRTVPLFFMPPGGGGVNWVGGSRGITVD